MALGACGVQRPFPTSGARREEEPPRASFGGGRVRALPAPGLPGTEAVLPGGDGHDGPHAGRVHPAGRQGRMPRGGHGNGPSGPPERPGAHPGSNLQGDHPGVRGHSPEEDGSECPPGRHGGREVPSRGGRLLHLAGRRPGEDFPGSQPVPPGVRESGGGGHHEVKAVWWHREGVDAGGGRRGSHPHPRGRGLRSGRDRGRDSQPRPTARLHHRRNPPHHHKQPGGIHHQASGGPVHPLCQRPGQGLRHPDHARQCRRPGGLPRGRAAGHGLPGPLP